MPTTATEPLEIILKIRTEGVALLDQAAGGTKRLGEEFKKTGQEGKDAFDKAGAAAEGFNVKTAALTAALVGYAATIKTLTVDTATYAARTQTLAVVTDQLAKVNNLNVGSVRGQVQAVRDLGISTQESLSTINKMIFANLDLAKATDLARLSQDAAVIAGVNSSDALQGIVHGIVTRQPEVLRTYGILVTFEQDFAKAARSLGRELTAAEKTQVALNVVLREGAKITGSYEAAMGTAGKQLTSLRRYVEEAENAVGQHFIPALGTTIHMLESMAKWAKENSEEFSHMAAGVTALSLALAAAKLTPGTPLMKGIVGGAVGLGAYMFGTQDPIPFYEQGARSQLDSISRRATDYSGQLRRKEITPEQYKTAIDTLERQKQDVRQRFIDDTAQIWGSRLGGADKIAAIERIRAEQGVEPPDGKYPAVSTDLGQGITISRRMILSRMLELGGKTAGTKDPLFNQELYNQQLNEALAEEFARKTKAAQKQVDEILFKLSSDRVDEFQKLLLEMDRDLNRKTETGAPVVMSPGQIQAIRHAYDMKLFYMGSDAATKARAYSDVNPELGGYQSPQARMMRDLSESWQQQLLQSQIGDFLVGRGDYKKGREEFSVESLTAFMEKVAGIRDKGAHAILDAWKLQESHQERMIELLAGPGGEIDAINRIRDLRIDAALKEFSLRKDQDAYNQAVWQAEYQREEELAALKRRQFEEYRQFAGQVFDMLNSRGGGGVGDFGRGMLKTLERQIFVNASGTIFQSLGGMLGGLIPGQTGADGKPTGIGKLLAGTLFSDQNKRLDAELASNTRETFQNTAVMRQLTAVIAAGVGGGAAGAAGGTVQSVLSSMVDEDSELASLLGLTGGGSGGGGSRGWAGSNVAEDEELASLLGMRAGGGGKNYQGYKTLGTAGTIAALGTGAFGVYSGLHQGGAQGGLTAASSALGTAAALDPEPVSRTILTIAAMASGFGAILFGDPKQRKAAQWDRMLSDARFSMPEAQNLTFDLYGNDVDFDYRGNARTIVKVYAPVNVDAMDADSFDRNAAKIAAATRRAMATGHDLGYEIGEYV